MSRHYKSLPGLQDTDQQVASHVLLYTISLNHGNLWTNSLCLKECHGHKLHGIEMNKDNHEKLYPRPSVLITISMWIHYVFNRNALMDFEGTHILIQITKIHWLYMHGHRCIAFVSSKCYVASIMTPFIRYNHYSNIVRTYTMSNLLGALLRINILAMAPSNSDKGHIWS